MTSLLADQLYRFCLSFRRDRRRKPLRVRLVQVGEEVANFIKSTDFARRRVLGKQSTGLSHEDGYDPGRIIVVGEFVERLAECGVDERLNLPLCPGFEIV
jgi:hypothetical protein